MPHLQVRVGPDRFHMEECRLNDTQHPHEIETEHFVGRVLVRVLNADGAKQGDPGREYFEGRSRKFCIQIEGRFKQRWSGNEILFGSDFDKFIDFPRAPFNAGMKVAKYIDPCTFYELHPKSRRPYIMSPYIACMNTFCAWPAPSRASDAVVVLRPTQKPSTPDSSRANTPVIDPKQYHDKPENTLQPSPHPSDDEDAVIVPRESLDRTRSIGDKNSKDAAKKKRGWLIGFSGGAAKEERISKKYWRFVGFKQEPRVRALLEAHHAQLHGGHPDRPLQRPVRQGSTGSVSSNDLQHGPARHTLSYLGIAKLKEINHTVDRARTPYHGYNLDDLPTSPQLNAFLDKAGALELISTPPVQLHHHPPATSAAPNLVAPKPKHGVVVPLDESEMLMPAHLTSAPLSPPTQTTPPYEAEEKPEWPQLERISTGVRHEIEESAKSDGLNDGDFKLADALARTHISPSNGSVASRLDDQLGPWRFADPGTDMIEDNAFIFTTRSLPVPQRRKHFASEKNRLDFHYDPDVVYGASFFTDAMDFNTFNLGIGPVRLNIARFFHDMPVRYTLRSIHDENITFVTISFQLVD